VDAASVVLDKEKGKITFKAKKGHVIDLDRLHESIWATRLGDSTGMALHRLEVTAEGEVIASGTGLILKMPGTDRFFRLGEEQGPAKGAFLKLREALDRGEKVVSVTGRVEGWQGNFTQFLKKLPDEPRRILITDFNTAKP
jgi:hypothetical protein